MKIKVRVYAPGRTHLTWRELTAYPVTLDGELAEFQLAAHRPPYDPNIDRWIVTEITCGAALGFGATRRKAVEEAKSRILAHGVARTRDMIAAQILSNAEEDRQQLERGRS